MMKTPAVKPEAYEVLRGAIARLRERIAEPPDASSACWAALQAYVQLPDVLQPAADALIAALPGFCEAIADVSEDPLETCENRALAAAAVNYFLMPYDIIPDKSEGCGIYGFLDDALLVRQYVSRLADDCPPRMASLIAATQADAAALLDSSPTFADDIDRHLEFMLELASRVLHANTRV